MYIDNDYALLQPDDLVRLEGKRRAKGGQKEPLHTNQTRNCLFEQAVVLFLANSPASAAEQRVMP